MMEDMKELQGLLLDDQESRVEQLPVFELSSSAGGAKSVRRATERSSERFEERREAHIVVDHVERLQLGSPGGDIAD